MAKDFLDLESGSGPPIPTPQNTSSPCFYPLGFPCWLDRMALYKRRCGCNWLVREPLLNYSQPLGSLSPGFAVLVQAVLLAG